MTHLVLIAPLKPGMVERARKLLDQGPPFDLESTAFDSHSVYLTDREVVFVFEGQGSGTLALQADDPGLRLAAEAWRECLSERPRVARLGFSWQRNQDAGEEA